VAGAHRLADENHEIERQDACDNNRGYLALIASTVSVVRLTGAG
jgi:hypothetical protein